MQFLTEFYLASEFRNVEVTKEKKNPRGPCLLLTIPLAYHIIINIRLQKTAPDGIYS